MAQISVGKDFLVAISTDQPAHKYFEKPKSNIKHKTQSLRKTLHRSKSKDTQKFKVGPLLNESLERKVYQTIVKDDQMDRRNSRKSIKTSVKKYEIL